MPDRFLEWTSVTYVNSVGATLLAECDTSLLKSG